MAKKDQLLREMKSRKQFEKCVYDECALLLARKAGVAIALTLKDFDYSAEETRKIWNKFNVHFESLNDGTISLEELENVLKEEYNVQIEHSKNIKIKH